MNVWWCEIHESGRKIANKSSRCDAADLIVLEGLWPARCQMEEKRLVPVDEDALLITLVSDGLLMPSPDPEKPNWYMWTKS